jgi:hypothetical protein
MPLPVINIYARNYKDFTSELRELKLKMISGEVNFEISKDSIKKFNTELKFIKKNFTNDIISGSIALNLFGLINRDISDIDILIKDESGYSRYNNHNYGDGEKLTPNRLGFIKFDYRKNLFSFKKTYEVDFFKDVGATFIEFEFDGIKLKAQHPIEIISQKMLMSKHHKHWRDLEIIFYKFGVL